jgi:hypothetical protein
MKTTTEFLEQLVKDFPELHDAIQEDTGLLHLQMGSFARITQTAIDSGDFEKLRRLFALAGQFFRGAEPDLQNAFYVSYLEHLDFNGPNGERAHKLMSSALRKGHQEITDYWEDLFHMRQGNKQPDGSR